MKEDRCIVWQEQSKIDFNFYDNSNNKKKQVSKEEFSEFLDKEMLNFNGKIVVNGGHFIPSLTSLTNPNEIGKNPIETWKTACLLVKHFFDKGFDSYVSCIINDLPFSPEERKKISLKLPEPYKEIADKNKIKTLVYSEKKLANKFSSQSKSTKWNVYGEEITNLCVQAIIAYLRDIKKQGVGVSIWITPKCSAKNLIEGVKIFDDKEGNLRNILYFTTENCFL